MRGTNGFAVLVFAALAGCASAAQECRTPQNVVRVDERNERLFVEASELDVTSPEAAKTLIQGAESYIHACRTAWTTKWSVSVFSDRKYAGYKDEQSLLPHVQSGAWQQAYLAEYDRADGSLVLFPAGKATRTQLKK